MGRGSEAFGLGLGSGAGRGEGFERERFGGAVKGVGGEGGTGPRVKMAGEASESGIPAAQFISDVPGALKGRDPGQLLQELQSQYQNYKMLEQRLMQARQRMQTKVRLGTGEGAHHPPVGGTRGVWGATLSPSLNFVSGLSLPNPLNPPPPPPRPSSGASIAHSLSPGTLEIAPCGLRHLRALSGGLGGMRRGMSTDVAVLLSCRFPTSKRPWT